MKKLFSVIISSFFLTAAMADSMELHYVNHTKHTSDQSNGLTTLNVIADIGDDITLSVENISTSLGAWNFNRNPVTAPDVNPYDFTVTSGGVYAVNTNSADGTVYFYICTSVSARPLMPPPIIGATSHCADAPSASETYHLEGIAFLPYCVNSYTWTAPNGATVTTSGNGVQATVTFPSGSVSGILSVHANTTSGTSLERKLFISCSNYTSRRLTAADADETSQVNVYPNPFTDKLNVTLNSDETFTLSISDITGKVIAKTPVTGQGTLDVSPFPKGIYFYTLSNGGGVLKRARIIKR
jgi:hypothetical protein